MSDRVPNAPLREQAIAMIDNGYAWNELAMFCGGSKAKGKGREREGDGQWLKRRLGLTPVEGKLHETMTYATAVRIARGLNMDPVDAGV